MPLIIVPIKLYVGPVPVAYLQAVPIDKEKKCERQEKLSVYVGNTFLEMRGKIVPHLSPSMQLSIL